MAKQSLTNWLYETDEIYRKLFDQKRKGWKDRNIDTCNYTFYNSDSYLDTLYKKIIKNNALKRKLQEVNRSPTSKCFLDIGSAPGALSKYLVGELKWSGFAVSLPVELGGREMEFKHDSLKYRDLDMSAADAYDQLSNWLDQHGATQFDFVNMGVLALYTGDNDVHKEERAKYDERTQNNGEALHAVYRNSMCVTLERLKEGGSVKWTLREPNLAELFRMLDILAKLFDHVDFVRCGLRAPFDLLCKGFRRDKAQSVLEVIRSQRLPLNEQDTSYWKCELEEAAQIYERHKTLLHVIWQDRMETLELFMRSRR